MPFYLRKSVRAGPFRFNFSKSGVGVSVGVKGLRVGTGPRGHYVHAGKGGLYYRATLGRAGERGAPQIAAPSEQRRTQWIDNVEMVEVDSGDILEMRDESLGALLDEINAKQSKPSMATLLGWGSAALAILVLLIAGGAGSGFLLIILLAWLIGKWLDSFKRSSVVFYDLSAEAEAAYQAVTDAFDQLAACQSKWHVEAGGAVRDLTTWKRNAGATQLVRKKPTTLGYSLPPVLKCNITPPAMQVGSQIIYFLPDAAFVVSGKKTGAVGYSDLKLQWQNSRFIEDGTVPSDAQVIGHVWKHPNKSGGPDRRFSNNYQIPLCLYEALHLSSASGVNELVEFSRAGCAEPFAGALQRLWEASGAKSRLRLSSSS